MTRPRLLGAILLATTALAAAQAHANPISLGYSLDGGNTVTAIALTSSPTTYSADGSASISGYKVGNFTISLSATGSPILNNPDFGSNTLTVSSTGPGSIILYASETNNTALVPSFTLGLSNNPLSKVSVTESVYASKSNTVFATGSANLLGSATLDPGVTTSLIAPFGALSAPYSMTQTYAIGFGSNGGQVNATILEQANSVPEPVSISLLGAGLAGIGFVRLRRRA